VVERQVNVHAMGSAQERLRRSAGIFEKRQNVVSFVLASPVIQE